MPDVIAVFYRNRKFIMALTFIATLIAVVIVVLLPKKYVSVATALPASSFATDKATIFNTNIQELYSALGTADDLDRIIGTARLDTIYIATARDLNLATHYDFSTDESGLDAATRRVKHRTTVTKSEWGELKIKAWDSDRDLAAQIANTVLQKLQSLHQTLRNQNNQLVLQKLKEAYGEAEPADTTAQRVGLKQNLKSPQREQRQVYEQLVSEYNLMVATNPPVLLVVENARPALYADTSEKTASVILTFFAALLFSILFALYTEGKRQRP
jgi:hypothetical protein